jgi:hypothetical protein
MAADASSAAARLAIDLAYVIARTGGDAGCAAVLQSLAPFMLQATAATHKQVKFPS